MMKLRRLFFALLTLPLAFAACEHEPTPTPEPEPNMTTVLTLTSEDTLDFTAEGGQGVIEYELVEETRNKPVPMPMVEATCEVDWVTDIAVAEDITFNVAANEGEARATKVVVTYGNQAFEVVVNQAAKPDTKPEPQEFNPVKVEAYRADSWDLGNFELDLYIDDNNYHSLDMQDLINPNDGHLTAGHYSMNDGSITEWSNFVRDIETGEGAFVVDAEITISHNADGTTNLKGYFESEYGDHLDIDWIGVVAGFVFGGTTPEPPTLGEGDVDVNISGAGVHANYYDDWYGVGADLWWVEIYEDDTNKSGRYIQLELLVDPAYDDWRGTFTALNDESTSYFATFVPGEIVDSSLSGAWYVELENGYISGAYVPIFDGTVECVFNEDGSKTIVLDCVDDAGNKIAGTVTSVASAQTYSAPTQKNHISLKRSVFAR